MKYDLHSYKEDKPKRFRRIIWYFFNIFLFPLLGNKARIELLRLFGANIGSFCRIYRSVRIYAPWNLMMKDRVCIGPRVEIYNKAVVGMGENIVVSQDSYICTASHDISSPIMKLVTKGVEIDDMTWIAAKSTILPGVVVGRGAVVGACAVVAKNVLPWSVVAGNPAKVVNKRVLKDI